MLPPLPEKVQMAVEILEKSEIASVPVAPLWYRAYLDVDPTTPPPLFGANKSAWRFATLSSTLAFMGIAFIFSLIKFNWFPLLLALACCVFYVPVMDATIRRSYERAGKALQLPAWEAFTSDWQPPSAESLRQEEKKKYFWLASLQKEKNFFLTAWIVAGFLTFIFVAYFLPQKRVEYFSLGISLLYAMCCMTGGFLTARGRVPSPSSMTIWEATMGLLGGFSLASLFWFMSVIMEVGAPIFDSKLPLKPAVLFMLSVVILSFCSMLQLFETISAEKQKTVALRLERADTERQLAEMRLSALKAQIEPHFIFNTISHIRHLISKDANHAIKMADELSDFLRASLRSLHSEWTTVSDDFKLVNAYLQLAKIRMDNRLEANIHAAPEAMDIKIPPLMLLTLVENAIQHGIEPRPEGGRIDVRAALIGGANVPSGKRLRLTVTDSGAGFGETIISGTGTGLANVRERLKSLYGADAALRLSTNFPSGVIAELEFPLRVDVT